MEKSEIRRQVRALKREVPLEEKKARSAALMGRLSQLPVFVQARTVLLYWSMDDEVYTHDFVRQYYTSKCLLLPCVEGDDLLLRQYTGAESMRPGPQFGIPEPVGQVYDALDQIDMIAVPGVAFDRSHNRMGRGRGFYDRLLKSTPNATKVGVAFDFQVFETIPVDSFDVAMDVVVCESGVY